MGSRQETIQKQLGEAEKLFGDMIETQKSTASSQQLQAQGTQEALQEVIERAAGHEAGLQQRVTGIEAVIANFH